MIDPWTFLTFTRKVTFLPDSCYRICIARSIYYCKTASEMNKLNTVKIICSCELSNCLQIQWCWTVLQRFTYAITAVGNTTVKTTCSNTDGSSAGRNRSASVPTVRTAPNASATYGPTWDWNIHPKRLTSQVLQKLSELS